MEAKHQCKCGEWIDLEDEYCEECEEEYQFNKSIDDMVDAERDK